MLVRLIVPVFMLVKLADAMFSDGGVLVLEACLCWGNACVRSVNVRGVFFLHECLC